MKETSLNCQGNQISDQYQIFIKNTTANRTVQKTFLPCNIKMKSVLKIMKKPLRAIPPKYPFTQ